MSQILKTAARTSIYPNNNGTGRDTYISFSNGGNTIMYQPNAKNITNGQMKRFTSGSASQSGLIPSKTIHYDSNGTGRDTYIMYLDGGLHGSFPKVASSDRFVTNLR